LLTFWGDAKKLEDKTLFSARPSLSSDRSIGICLLYEATKRIDLTDQREVIQKVRRKPQSNLSIEI
jgi:hypothetical protein